MNITTLTPGQREALKASLENQAAPMTPAEIRTLRALTQEEMTIEETLDGIRMERQGDKVRMIEMDTFGEDYRNRWIKIQSTEKGEYFTSYYLGNKRKYLNNDNYMG